MTNRDDAVKALPAEMTPIMTAFFRWIKPLEHLLERMLYPTEGEELKEYEEYGRFFLHFSGRRMPRYRFE